MGVFGFLKSVLLNPAGVQERPQGGVRAQVAQFVTVSEAVRAIQDSVKLDRQRINDMALLWTSMYGQVAQTTTFTQQSQDKGNARQPVPRSVVLKPSNRRWLDEQVNRYRTKL